MRYDIDRCDDNNRSYGDDDEEEDDYITIVVKVVMAWYVYDYLQDSSDNNIIYSYSNNGINGYNNYDKSCL